MIIGKENLCGRECSGGRSRELGAGIQDPGVGANGVYVCLGTVIWPGYCLTSVVGTPARHVAGTSFLKTYARSPRHPEFREH